MATNKNNQIINLLRARQKKEKFAEQINTQADERIFEKIGTEAQITELKSNALKGAAAKSKIDNDIQNQEIESTSGAQTKVNSAKNSLENSLNKLQKDVEGFNLNVQDLAKNIKNVEEKTLSLQSSLNSLDSKVDGLDATTQNLNSDLTALESRVTNIEKTAQSSGSGLDR